jgi:hypothetical protein
LAGAVEAAQAQFAGSVKGATKLINDLYAGRDPISGGVPLGGVPWNATINPTSVGTWTFPQVGANLAQARIEQLRTELVPAVPSFQVEALTTEATHLAEEQAKLMPWLTRAACLRQAMRKTAMNGLMGPHFGVKVVVTPKGPPEERIKYIAIPASHCGYEPHHRRFMWHTYQCQWADLVHKPDLTGETMNDWDLVSVTEVYHRGFAYSGKKCPVSFYVVKEPGRRASDPIVATDISTRDHGLGDYVTTVEVPTCPLHIDSFLEPAPNEAIPPTEIASWIPVLRSIHADILQLEEEVGNINNIILYDREAFSDEMVAAIEDNPSGHTIYVAVDNSNALGSENGVSHKMRPVERNSAIGEIITALQTHMQLLDEVVGVSSLDRGVAANPRKSATEASAIVQANNRRTRSRLTVIADAFGALGRITYDYLKTAFPQGNISIPGPNGVIHNIQVPDAAVARMGFRVEPTDLGNLSKQGQIETHSASITLFSNLRQQAPDLFPPTLLIEEARKYLLALGNHAAAASLKVPPSAGGPQERIMDYLIGRTVEIPVTQQDDHEQFIAAYQQAIADAATTSSPAFPVAEVQRALAQHQAFANARPQPAAPQSPAAGFTAQGAQMAGGMSPEGIPLDPSAIGELSLNQIR